MYYMENHQLYKISFSMSLLMYSNEEELDYVPRELHARIYGGHVAKTSLALKALRNGYFWLTMKAHALNLVKRFDKCQRYAYVPRKPFTEQLPLMATWSFDQWGVDLLGPFPIALEKLKYLVVAIEYFTKWIEVEPLVAIIARNVQ